MTSSRRAALRDVTTPPDGPDVSCGVTTYAERPVRGRRGRGLILVVLCTPEEHHHRPGEQERFTSLLSGGQCSSVASQACDWLQLKNPKTVARQLFDPEAPGAILSLKNVSSFNLCLSKFYDCLHFRCFWQHLPCPTMCPLEYFI
ncbi:hypothetical protein chiPu_0013160 [Chiloscyllium punctatum]|uniref:Uncharacterized protein n=1 Tax=Chiloscyllium punctatum TaxID=137246 RepID=A0A401SWB5_CHIPU|nr:hypothetical protein [Chiloscyllium punctatum]